MELCQAEGPVVLASSPGPISWVGKEIAQTQLGITQLILGSDLSPWIPPSGVGEGGWDGARGWSPSSLSNWVRECKAVGRRQPGDAVDGGQL